MLGLSLGFVRYEDWLRPLWMPSNELPWQNCRLIPAVGNAVNAVTELILAGTACEKLSGAIWWWFLLSAEQDLWIHYGLLSLSFASLAVAQPVSDKRIVAALLIMGEGCPASADHADCGNLCVLPYSSHGVCRRIKVTVSGNEP